jgi:hypothetical protein
VQDKQLQLHAAEDLAGSMTLTWPVPVQPVVPHLHLAVAGQRFSQL